MRCRRYRNDGFTFIEMIVVVIVIGVLITLALPNYAFVFEKTKSGEALQILESIRHAQLAYYYENNNTFADDLADLDLEIPTPEHFDALTDADIHNPGNFTDPVGEVTRTTGDYNITISANGTVVCTPAAICAKLGL
ncbi:MAG: prepilin-type N-terminal cleavage/methylation domain-containing protein [Candidatus Omnitrophica bacterium]|nr:prepilin-type N-terminal cleavage/methylation domain-containing protein [Candidatus Omnitrophota bacterium]MCA9404778.1 prepilin-type N-terminal cleavage/methylation domain-containing protein [Candidatus Omnitrophota bacterium]MCB9721799.1 prepilin-type N-terminal cleavage/methylation domain-containing protein [Candidatus Omnitrophota bacterium]